MRIDGAWYDLSGFEHPGGSEVLRRTSGGDVTHLFYANHAQPKISLLRAFELDLAAAPHAAGPSLDERSLDPHSPLYRELKAEVFAHLDARGVEWRHTFRWEPYGLRLLCLLAAHAAIGLPSSASASALGVGASALYGLVTGRMTWTHAHNGVHNPRAIPRAMRALMRFDFVCVVEAWMAEHHAHHAHTNRAADPDVGWYAPLFDYRSLHASGGSAAAAAAAVLVYPLLLPVMLTKSLAHAAGSDPDGRAMLATVLLIAPIRFGIDALLLGPAGFGVALGTATAYICVTFVATHQTERNYESSAGTRSLRAPAPAGADADWMVDQMHATNDVWPESAAWSVATGGISHHIEHHLFPQISSAALPEVSVVVRRFAARHGLPYHSYSPLSLLTEHARFVAGCPAARARAAARLAGGEDAGSGGGSDDQN